MVALRKSDSSEEIQQLLASVEPKIKRAFLEAIATLKDPETLNQLLELLRNGDTTGAMALVEKNITPFASKTLSFYTIAGAAAASTLSTLVGAVIDFNQTNARAVAIMQQNRLRLISEFTDDQRAIVRNVMTAGITRGINPMAQAEEFKQFIGLTERQMKAVLNYRRLLEQNSVDALTRALRDARFDSTVASAINSGTGLTQSQIDRMVERYAQQQLDFRAQTIARTEALRAVNQGSYEALLQAVDNGDLQQDELENTWITAGDSRVRDSHAEMHGQKRSLGEAFISGNGVELLYPGDPSAPASEIINCRCVLTTRMKPTNQEEN